MAGLLNALVGVVLPFPGAIKEAITLPGAFPQQKGGSATKRYLSFDDEMGRWSLVLSASSQLSKVELGLSMEMCLSSSLGPSGSAWRACLHATALPDTKETSRQGTQNYLTEYLTQLHF